MKNIITAVLLSFAAATTVSAQNESYEQMGGVYYAYHYESGADNTPVPQGYKAFYISHYGRHGSRWLPSEDRYTNMWKVFADSTRLTPLGRDVRRRLQLICADAQGRAGDLTALGAQQQREIAERMARRWPSVFAHDGAKVEARSSTVGRCAASMTAFLLKLQSMQPELDITATTHSRYMPWIAYASPEQKAYEAAVPRDIKVSPRRLMASLFLQPDSVPHALDLLSELHCIASDMQDACIGISLYDIFTPEEMRAVYDASNLNMYTCNGENATSTGIPERSAISLWQNFCDEADSAIAHGLPAATLRFGHDTSLYRLLTLMGLLTSERHMDRIVPMGANLFMAFYRNSAGHILVKVLHNEHELILPIASTTAPYYDWNEVKKYMQQRILKVKK